ncbi:hypothetical protein IAU59_003890 [Kwoniella sp. CBS 9459]
MSTTASHSSTTDVGRLTATLKSTFDTRPTDELKAAYLSDVDKDKTRCGEQSEIASFQFFQTVNGDRSTAYERRESGALSQTELDSMWQRPGSHVSKKLDPIIRSDWFQNFNPSQPSQRSGTSLIQQISEAVP